MTYPLPTSQFRHYINGELVPGAGRTAVISCPGNQEEVAQVALATREQALAALDAARDAFPAWSALSLEERGSWMMKLRDAIAQEADNLLNLLLLESGKLRSHAAFEIGSLTGYLNFFLEQAKSEHTEGIRDTTGGKSMFLAVREPVGVVVAALAWNFPMHNMATKLGPILASGCTAVIKPATKTPLSTLYLGEILHRIGFPKGVINFVATGMKAGDTSFTTASYSSRIAGVLAGTPSDCSATYAPLEELTEVTAMDSPDAAVDAGKLFLIDDGRQVKLSRAVTSKTTLGDEDPEMLKKIKLVAAVDLIRYYAITTVEDEYLGKCANTYDNKCILLVAFSDFFTSLEAQNVVQSGTSGAELDAEAIREFLLTEAEEAGNTAEVSRIKALSDDALRKEDTGSHVFLHLYGHVLDAMEDFHITLEAQ